MSLRERNNFRLISSAVNSRDFVVESWFGGNGQSVGETSPVAQITASQCGR